MRVSPLAAAVSVIDGAAVASNAVSTPKMKEKFRAEYRDARTLAPCNKMSRSHFQCAGARRRASRGVPPAYLRDQARATTHGAIPAVRAAESPEIRGWSAAIKSLVGNRVWPLAFPPDKHTLSQLRGEK